MKFPAPVNIKWIAELINAEKIIGNKDSEATGLNELHTVEEGDIVFVDHPKYYEKCIESNASFIIINTDNVKPQGKTLLITNEPFEAYCKIANHFRPFEPATGNVGISSKIGEGTYIYPTAFIGNNVVIGNNCLIHPQVTIMDHCIIGNNVVIQAGTIIGSDAFYYNGKSDRAIKYKKMPSVGRVILEDDVEIGAGCAIDRGVSNDTIIGEGTKMDNHVHIGHETVIGKNGLFAAGTDVAGVVNIGNNVTVWGQVGISKTLTIGDNAVLLAKTGVPGDLEGDKIYWGSPAQEASIKRRELVWIKRIPALWEKVMNK